MADFQFVNTEPSESKDTRSGFGQGLLEAGRANENVVGLCADLTGSLKMNAFQDAFPHRFFQVGIAEANMMGVAAGMTIGGKIPFTGTLPTFLQVACTIRFDRASPLRQKRQDMPLTLG